jgi:hypothetical protein
VRFLIHFLTQKKPELCRMAERNPSVDTSGIPLIAELDSTPITAKSSDSQIPGTLAAPGIEREGFEAVSGEKGADTAHQEEVMKQHQLKLKDPAVMVDVIQAFLMKLGADTNRYPRRHRHRIIRKRRNSLRMTLVEPLPLAARPQTSRLEHKMSAAG